MIEDPKDLRGASLVTWLVTNTEDLVRVAAALEEKAGELAPDIPAESVVRLCQTARHAALEMTVALLALISRSNGQSATSVLDDAMAHVHAGLQAREDEPRQPEAGASRT